MTVATAEILCKDCGVTFPPSGMFYVCKTRPTGQCRGCRSIARRAWYVTHTAAAKGYSARWKKGNRARYRDAMRKSKYGLPYGGYAEMLKAQGGGCAICGAPPPAEKALHVDHDHETGAIRELLCDRCNRGLGYFSEDVDRLISAAAYLWRHRGGDAL